MRLLLAVCLFSLAGCFGALAPQPGPARRAAAPPPVTYTNPAFQQGPAELEAMVTKWTAGYQPIGAAVAGRLEAFQPLQFEVARGRCYMAVLRLQEGAQFSEHARRGVAFVFDMAGTSVNGGPGIAGPGGVGSAGCPQRGGTSSFDLQAYWGSALDKTRVHELGTGPYTVQFFIKAISEGRLQAQQADQERQLEESRRFHQQRAAETCRRCVRQREECRDGRHRPFGGTCLREFDSCLSRSSVRADECPY